MDIPLISCIVPVFNGERYLRETLDSIFAQTYRRLEIIVADDGSTDRTAEIVAGYSERVRYLKQANAGASAARNLGLRAARGDFVAFLDADDLWHAEKLQRQMARFETRPELEVSVTLVQNFRVAEPVQHGARSCDRVFSKPLPGYVAQTILARRSAFEVIGPFNPALLYADKTEWFLRAAEKQTVVELLSDSLVYRRLHENNISRRSRDEMNDEYLRLLKANIDRRRSDQPGRCG